MLAVMLPSEKLECGIYKFVETLAPVAASATVTQLSQVTGEQDYGKIVERLKDLDDGGQIILRKFNGGQINLRGDSPDKTFFYAGPFAIEIAPRGRKYFEELEQKEDQEGRFGRLWGPGRQTEEKLLPPPKSPPGNAHLLPPKKAIEILRKLISDATALLPGEPFGSARRDEWTGTAQGILERAFAPGSSILNHFRAARSISFKAGSSDEQLRRIANGVLSSEVAVLQSAAEQLGWELDEEGALTSFSGSASATGLQIFISHSSKDHDLAEALTDLLKAALGLLPTQVRCSSVDGHRLPVGVNTESKLRDEVNAAKVVVGLLTPDSLASSFVMFELGARWGAKLFLAPLLAGIQPGKLGGPLNLQNALSANSENELHQLLDDISRELGVQLQSTSSYLKHVSAVKRLADRTSDSANTAAAKPSEPEIRQVGAVNYYFVGDKGPYCQPCYDVDPKAKRLVMVTPPEPWSGGQRRHCPVCHSYFQETKKESGPTQLGGRRGGAWS
ncbi:MAG: toll/interleukin-1 receptor domain-containing protein [Candidatus Sulfotelmatobacter sp.]